MNDVRTLHPILLPSLFRDLYLLGESMRRMLLLSILLLMLFGSLLHAQPVPSIPADRTKLLEFFENKVRPVLSNQCLSCHNAQKHKGGIRLDRKEFVFKASEEPLIVPGQPGKSLLLRAIRHEGDHNMPPAPREKLPGQVLEDFAAWIQQGAVWPEDAAATTGSDPRQHWAFQPLRKVELPVPKNAEGSVHPIDAFILARLEAKGLSPNPGAEPRTLLRRLNFDLIGLPPSPEEVDAFVKDWGDSRTLPATRQALLEKTVDRLLASPHYGERWARHWLDVARYADTKGYVFQEERRYPYAYTYRDYVVKAFNDDLPYDQFILQQLAADRLVAQGKAPASAQAAMGYLTLGRRFLNNIHDITDDRIDVVTRGLLGLTVACARCHDHKYDPISARDYYGLYGIFASSVEPKELPLIAEPAPTAEYHAFQKKLQELQNKVADYQTKNKVELDKKNRKFQDELRALQKQVDAHRANSAAAPPRGMVMIDAPNPHDVRVLLRGNPGTPGSVAPRQFLTILAGEKPEPFREGSGRLELARAIADRHNPLTARVIVNRLWLHHFGAGLVATPSDFGVRSEPPSHPELLDYLASRFMNDGWSIKKMHRLMVLSKTYQRNSAEHPRARAIDPDNRLLACATLRRLDFEALRDALLTVSGKIDLKVGGPAVDIIKAPYSSRRTLYGFVDRQNLPGLLRTFDFASPDTSTPQRFQTTVPQQALYLLNHPFVQEQARAVLHRVELANKTDSAAKIQLLHRIIYTRSADADEVRLGQAFVEESSRPTGANAAGGMTSWERYAQILLLANEFAFVD